MTKPFIWAHRGASSICPENTMEAFRKAIELGADGIELDVQISDDGQLIVIHDEKVDRTALMGQGYAKDMSVKILKELNVGNPDLGYDNCRIPLLEEVLDLLKPTNLFLNIELKTGVIDYEGIEEKTLALVKQYGMEDRVIYSSFNYITIQNVKRLDPTAKIAYLYYETMMDMCKYALDTGVPVLHPYYEFLEDKAFVEECHKNNIELNVWTVDNEKEIKLCVDSGVHAIITNDIEGVRKVLETL